MEASSARRVARFGGTVGDRGIADLDVGDVGDIGTLGDSDVVHDVADAVAVCPI